ncbi:MAG: AraC family transcriptional regulator [Acidobacteria bacterium]|nr:AraC family transcriptional regulator [Acidobacteriota bacterium]
MSTHDPTAIARLPLFIARGTVRFGLDPDTLLRDAGFRETELADADSRVPIAKLRRLWTLIGERVPDPAVGMLVAENRVMRDLGLVTYTMRLSESLGEALRRLARYSQVVAEDLIVVLRRRADRAEIELQRAFLYDPLRLPVDFRLYALLSGIRLAVQRDLLPLEAHFPYPAPDDTATHRRLFRCPLHFGEKSPRLVLRGSDLELPIATADPTLLGYLDRLAEQARQELSRDGSTADGVRRVLWQEMPGGRAAIGSIAARLGLSGRSLQRRLAEEGTSYKEVLDSFRRGMARRLLHERDVAIYEVAYLLGYSDPSAFHRAFRRWHGDSPRKFRASRD